MSRRQFGVSSLADILLDCGVLSRGELDAALAEQKRAGLRLDETLVRGGYATDNRIAAALSSHLGLPLLSFDEIHPTEEALALIPESAAARLCVMPLAAVGGKISVAMADPLDMEAADEIRLITGREPEMSVAARGDLERAAIAYYRVKGSASEAAGSAPHEITAARERSGDVSEAEAGAAPVVRLVNSLLDQAARERASDIHIEPSDEGTRVRFRIDGRLVRGAEISAALHPALAARIKILAGMDISEKRRPQDGRIFIKASGADIDIRVSSLPSIFGEKLVLRLLRQGGGAASLESLGFDTKQRELLQRAINAPNGIVLLTGPTGSGKSTTLYSLLNMLNDPSKNIITIEDPVEYTINGITQVQINEKIPRRARGADRPPCAQHAPHERRAVVRRKARRHGRAALPARIVAARRRGPAPRAQALPVVPCGRRSCGGARRSVRTAAGRGDIRAVGLCRVPFHGICRTHGRRRNHAGERADS